MSIFFNYNLSPFNFPDESGSDFNPGDAIDVGDDSSDTDDIDDTNDGDSDGDDEEYEEVVEDEASDEDEDEIDEDDEVEAKPKKAKKEEEEESEDDADLNDPDSPLNTTIIKAASKKYPGLFKEFPELRSAFFFGRQMRAFFPTVEDARDAVSSLQSFNFIQDEITNGNPDTLVDFLKNDEDTLFKFAKGFNRKLAKLNPDVHAKVHTPIITNLIKAMREEASLHNNENLNKVADWVAKFVFNTTELPKDAEPRDVNRNNPEAQKLLAQQARDFRESVATEGYESRNKLVNDSLAKIKASPVVKKALAREINNILSETLTKDKAHMSYMTSLWNRSQRAGFTRQEGARINQAYLDAIKRALPGARERALKESGLVTKKIKKTKIDLKDEMSNRSDSRNKPAKNAGSGSSKKDPRAMSDLEFLNHLEKSGK